MSRLRVAVTGAGGRVGSALVARLSSRQELDVVAIVRNALTARLLDGEDAEIRIGSVTDPAASRDLLRGCDAVVNCALATGAPAAARRENEAIIRAIADVPGVRAAVHFSTVAVYGACVDAGASTFERPRPDSSYGADKLRLERLAAQAFSARRIRHYIVRLGHVYGPGQWVSRDILERTADPSFALPFGGELASNAVSIEAVAAAVRMMLTGEQPSGVRNLFDSPQTTWRSLYDLHTGLLGRAPAASLSEAASRELRARHYALADQPLRVVARAALSAARAMDFVALARLEAFRHLVHGPLCALPAPLAGWLNRVYGRRKVRSALRGVVSAPELPANFLCSAAVSGPCFATIDSREAARGMREPLRAWLDCLASYRWDAVAAGLVAQGGRRIPAAIATETPGRGAEPLPETAPVVALKPTRHA